MNPSRMTSLTFKLLNVKAGVQGKCMANQNMYT
jgi:hypothetical protein